MQVLQAKVNILDVAVLDQVEARLQVRGDGRRELHGGCHRAVGGALTKAVKSRVGIAGFGGLTSASCSPERHGESE